MTYRVAFAKRIQSDGNESVIDPSSELDGYLADGVVAEKNFVERLESDAQHSQEALDEDDAFLGVASTEVWEYVVVDGRRDEFEDAIRNSETAMEFEVVDETSTEQDEAGAVALGDSDTRVSTLSTADNERTSDDGPAGHVTVDSSAGGVAAAHTSLSNRDGEGIVTGDEDEMTITSADDPRLGLTGGR